MPEKQSQRSEKNSFDCTLCDIDFVRPSEMWCELVPLPSSPQMEGLVRPASGYRLDSSDGQAAAPIVQNDRRAERCAVRINGLRNTDCGAIDSGLTAAGVPARDNISTGFQPGSCFMTSAFMGVV